MRTLRARLTTWYSGALALTLAAFAGVLYLDRRSASYQELDQRIQSEASLTAGILAESRPPASWVVLGIGVNVAVRLDDLPPELHGTAGTLGLRPGDLEPTLERMLAELERALALEPAALLDAYRARDALRGREITWSAGRGRAAGIDGAGRLVVELPGGGRSALAAGEVHLKG